MKHLQYYVDQLFKEHKDNKQTNELKDEILSNLEAKVADLTANGMEYTQAVKVATDNISGVELLIDGNTRVYTNKYRIEFLQIALLYFLIAWVITIPLRLVGMGILLNIFLLIVVFVVGILFFVLNAKKESYFWGQTSIYNINIVMRYRKIAWLIWGLFVTVSILGNTAVVFGSSIWFGREINITGPYQLAVLVFRFLLPFVFIIIPLLFHAALKLIRKYEVGENHENQE
ncbi:permease prefix domain 1-containing protein [Paenibacillus sp. J5C_2022]|uniref:permease prefix domain 1-containing protein n=1 Tax=Paenibacillus sp. J5C2022 TaxID=2977129 RepID=UPI0021CEE1E1|nr:permease prefix domain 1-containing protein [Paenibacillus sp. J5C2022]MCU6707374.1 permease prefix domain 1-containing protein [Paenibacillus sp. J5C2022]